MPWPRPAWPPRSTCVAGTTISRPWSTSSPVSGSSTSTPARRTCPRKTSPTSSTQYTERVREHLDRPDGPDAIHANYWLSGMAGHVLKHDLSLPLVSTFHTLARVKAETGDPEPALRIDAEAEVIACSDAILANCADEATQLVELYGADPSRVEMVPPGVDHAFFSPGDQGGARAALGLGDHPVLLFVGRIQPLKGLTVALGALAELTPRHPDAVLVVVGGPSGRDGETEMAAARALIAHHGLDEPSAVRPASAPPHALDLLPGRRRRRRSQPLRVVRPRRPRSCGLRRAGGGRRRGWAADPGGGWRDRPARRHPRPCGLRRRRGRVAGSADGRRGHGRRPPRSGRADYTWSTTAARLRRLYADLTARTPVSCS